MYYIHATITIITRYYVGIIRAAEHLTGLKHNVTEGLLHVDHKLTGHFTVVRGQKRIKERIVWAKLL